VTRDIKITACWHVTPCSLIEGTSVLEERAAPIISVVQITWPHVFKDVILTHHILSKSRLPFVIAMYFSFMYFMTVIVVFFVKCGTFL